jgi:hypothetical protein
VAATGKPPAASNGSVAGGTPVTGEPEDTFRAVAVPGASDGPDETASAGSPPPTGDTSPWPDASAGHRRSLDSAASPDDPDHPEDDGSQVDDVHWIEEYHDVALFSSIFSAPSLALAGFVFALTGLLGGMIPESLPYLIQIDPSQGPAFHVRLVGVIALGFAIIAASLGLAAMLRSIGSPLRWPRYLGGAAVLLALLIALQAVLLIGLAGMPGPPGLY